MSQKRSVIAYSTAGADCASRLSDSSIGGRCCGCSRLRKRQRRKNIRWCTIWCSAAQPAPMPPMSGDRCPTTVAPSSALNGSPGVPIAALTDPVARPITVIFCSKNVRLNSALPGLRHACDQAATQSACADCRHKVPAELRHQRSSTDRTAPTLDVGKTQASLPGAAVDCGCASASDKKLFGGARFAAALPAMFRARCPATVAPSSAFNDSPTVPIAALMTGA